MSNCLFCPTAHWFETFNGDMVDKRAFLVTRSLTIGVPMMHRTGGFYPMSLDFGP